jgi:hypothetical protein
VTSDDHSGAGRGTLLLADITGYTAFLQAVGAAHAADMAAGTFVPKAYPLLTSLIGSVGFVVVFLIRPARPLEGIFLALAAGGVGAAVRSLLPRGDWTLMGATVPT